MPTQHTTSNELSGTFEVQRTPRKSSKLIPLTMIFAVTHIGMLTTAGWASETTVEPKEATHDEEVPEDDPQPLFPPPRLSPSEMGFGASPGVSTSSQTPPVEVAPVGDLGIPSAASSDLGPKRFSERYSASGIGTPGREIQLGRVRHKSSPTSDSTGHNSSASRMSDSRLPDSPQARRIPRQGDLDYTIDTSSFRAPRSSADQLASRSRDHLPGREPRLGNSLRLRDSALGADLTPASSSSHITRDDRSDRTRSDIGLTASPSESRITRPGDFVSDMTRGANDFSSPRNKKMPANASDLSIGLPGRQIESGDALPPPILPPQFSGPHRGARRTGSVDSPVKGPRQLANRYSAQKRNTRRRPAETPKSPITDPTPQQIEMMMNGLKSAREGRKRLE